MFCFFSCGAMGFPSAKCQSLVPHHLDDWIHSLSIYYATWLITGFCKNTRKPKEPSLKICWVFQYSFKTTLLQVDTCMILQIHFPYKPFFGFFKGKQFYPSVLWPRPQKKKTTDKKTQFNLQSRHFESHENCCIFQTHEWQHTSCEETCYVFLMLWMPTVGPTVVGFQLVELFTSV